ncbi:MAG: murein biosynthesis integral membrane protein MurJ [Gammaproteobacteria bacterium]|nr:murein biosynthesis integral membrane protein MurJ [Gammaproteobacteria bacterium]
MTRKLLQSTLVVGFNTLLSRVLGFVRDMIIARVFGVSVGTDAFFVAFRIPNFMRRLFAEGAFGQAFVPVLAEYQTQRSEDDTRHLVQHVMGTLGGALALVTVAGMLAAPLIVAAFAPGFVGVGDKFALTTELLRITFPYLLFIALTALAGAVLNSFGRFAIPAFTPVFLNLCMIVAALWVAPTMNQPVEALAWGVFVAGIVQLLFQLPFLYRLRLLRWPRWDHRDAGVRRIARLMLPAIFGSSVAQINLLFDTLVASFLVTGSVSWLYYSDRLVEFPLGVFGMALGTAILPSLAKNHAQNSQSEFAHTLDWGLRLTLLVGLPATLGLMLLSEPIVTTLFRYGEFSADDAHMTALSLMTYSLGLLGFILVKVLAPGFFARQDTKTPVMIGVIAMVANIVMTAALVLPMLLLDIPGAHAALALATALAAYINAGLLFVYLRRAGVYRPLAGWRTLGAQTLFANTAMATLLWFGVPSAEMWAQLSTSARAGQLVLWIVAAGIVYFICLMVSGVKLKELIRLRTS